MEFVLRFCIFGKIVNTGMAALDVWMDDDWVSALKVPLQGLLIRWLCIRLS